MSNIWNSFQHGSHTARWGRVVGRCADCGKMVRSRACEQRNGVLVHSRDGGMILATEV